MTLYKLIYTLLYGNDDPSIELHDQCNGTQNNQLYAIYEIFFLTQYNKSNQ